ncbi:hypothetical protein PPYR_06809 [Photinus pyralis]|uniref:Aminopeptidase n=1 Tax=Photinus pyralis TaxID=7054 RepID=A0A1Y1K3D7_PHOPY|nr:aminopeptidase N-like [Photinus pyralis]KAB0798929.1 hypothetical protein PPYR_06809 [Photinus pyralis]
MQNSIIMWFILLSSSGTSTAAYEIRLPQTLIPERYNLKIVTDLKTFTFSGIVWIHVNCINETNRVVLHSKGLTLNTKRIIVKNAKANAGDTLKATNFSFYKENDFFEILLDKPVRMEQRYEIFIPFNGTLGSSLSGYYRSSYNNTRKGRKKWLSVTQFEPIFARNAFPCFDEPAMKASFKISLGRRRRYSSISNMPLLKTEAMRKKPGWFWDHFEESVPMSTYLVAFVVSDFEFEQFAVNGNSTTFRIWARSSAINQVQTAKNFGPSVLNFFEEYFNIPYPLPKLDMIAVPDFGEAAMENWGLITFRESYLLTENVRHGVGIIEPTIAHEVAHQWFGNLVTMKWWTDIWLNEGFATYMATIALHYIYPEYGTLVRNTLTTLLTVFRQDSLKSSHPVSVPVEDPRDITQIFDSISYTKGAILLHMISNFLSEDTFKKGVTHYLNKHKFENAEQNDLWQALTVQAHKDQVLPPHLTIGEIMDTWSLQVGYPLVTVTRDYQSNSAVLKQERFILDTEERDNTSCWWIPITYTTEQQINTTYSGTHSWMECPLKTEIINNLPDKNQWILFNLNTSGLYRVNYDEHNWKLLIAALKSKSHGNIGLFNRIQLIEDSAALAWAGKLHYSVFFDVLSYLENESDARVWGMANFNLEILGKLVMRTSVFGTFREYMKRHRQIHNKTKGEQHAMVAPAIERFCAYNKDDCIKDSRRLFEQLMKDPIKNPVPPKNQPIVYCNALKHGEESEWNFLWNLYKTSNSASEQSLILNILGCTREVWLLERYLDWAIDPSSEIRKQDVAKVFGSVVATEIGYYVAKNFLWKRMEDIHNYIGGSSFAVSELIQRLAQQMIYQVDYEELKDFTLKHSNYFIGSQKAITQSLETVKLQVQWHQTHFETIENILSVYNEETLKY